MKVGAGGGEGGHSDHYAERYTLSLNYVNQTLSVSHLPIKKENTTFHICVMGENYLKVLQATEEKDS